MKFASYAAYRDNNKHAGGLEDSLFQVEYALYKEENEESQGQFSVIAGLYLPTGSASYRVPNTGFGLPAIFLGTAFVRTGSHWYWFTSYGAVLTCSDSGRKIGNQYLYQGGIGRYIATFWPDWLFCWLIEADGQFSEQNRYRRINESDTGGNVIYLTPSIFISNWNWRFQLGAGYPVHQHLFGRQNRLSWIYVLDIAYSIR